MRRSLLSIFCIVAAISICTLPQSPLAQAYENAAGNGGMAQVIVELVDPPAVVVLKQEKQRHTVQQARKLAQDSVHRLDQMQQRMLPSINHLGGTVLFRLQRVYSGIAVRLPAANIAALRALPGVKAIHAAVPLHATNAVSVPLINAPAAWTYANGLTGTGIKMAIIDTGIDYTHADFGGAGTRRAYDIAASDPTVLEPGSGFPSTKIVGGLDFVGNTYNADGTGEQTIPMPDPDPLDCYGHGTHVAGTAAGYGVTSNGRTYRGPYDTMTPFNTLKIGPGVAPHAQLYVLKIFGCSGSSIVTPAAIEWSIDPNGDGDFSDRMDVINLSIGSPFGTNYDATAVAVENAALAGTVVVCSAGNDGDTYYDISTPSAATSAIAVASSGYAGISSFSSRGPRRGDNAPKPDISAPGENIYSALRGGGSDGTLMSGTSMAAPHVAGTAALMRELHPDWSVEEIKAALLNSAAPRIMQGSTPYSTLRSGTGRIDAGRSVRETLLAYSADDPGLVSLSFGAPEVLDHLTLVKNLRIANKQFSGPPVSYTLNVSPTLSVAGVSIKPTIDTITLQPGTSMTVPIVLSIPDAHQLGYQRDPTLEPTTNGLLRHFLNEVAGSIILTPSDPQRQTLQVSYFAAPRRAGALTVPAPHIALSETVTTTTLTMRGTSMAEPTLVSAYELQLLSPKRTPSPTETDIVTDVGQAADLQYVGVASEAGRSNFTSRRISFGLATYKPWTTPAEVRFEIGIDSDLDGGYDHTIYSTDYGPGGEGSGFGDVFVAFVRDETTGSIELAGQINYLSGDIDNGIYNGRVLGIGVGASQIGLSAAHTRFNYRIRTYHIDAEDATGTPMLMDETPLLTYDLAKPGITVTAPASFATHTPLYRVRDGTKLQVRTDGIAFHGNRSKGVLLLYHTNGSMNQAQAIQIKDIVPARHYQTYIPSLQR